MGKEKNPDYYDNIFTTRNEYLRSYKESPYWVHWTQVIKFLGNDKTQKILEIGCGTGQLAEYIRNEGFVNYSGFDFSPQAIKLANKKVPDFTFKINNALSKNAYQDLYDTAICLEVLEHLNNDIDVILNIEEGKTLIFSVPNFDDPGHVRWFISERQIKSRYYKLLDIRSIVRIGNIYVCKAIRKNFQPNFFQKLVKSREEFSSKSFSKRYKYYLSKIKTYIQK